MASFNPSKKTAIDFNNGVKYIDYDEAQGIMGDGVQADTINNLVESALYTQEQATNAELSASNAQQVAENLESIANSANETATEAQKKAKEAYDLAEQANTTANNAIGAANEANATAGGAETAASAAISMATEASNKADSAETNSKQALNTANSANTTAESALETAEQAKSEVADKANKSDIPKIPNITVFTNGLGNAVTEVTALGHVITVTRDQTFATSSELNTVKSIANSAIPDTEKGVIGGVATLDSTGKVPTSQLPSYVSDVFEYDKQTSFPKKGEENKIYVAKDTNKTYRWSGTAYVEISPSLALGETSATAYAGNKGKTNADNITALQTRMTAVESKNTTQDTDISTAQKRADDAYTLLTGLATVATSGSYTDLKDTPAPYSLPTASTTVLGGVKLGSDTVQTVSAGTPSAIAGRTYPVQKNSAGQMVVNVPWEGSEAGDDLVTTNTPQDITSDKRILSGSGITVLPKGVEEGPAAQFRFDRIRTGIAYGTSLDNWKDFLFPTDKSGEQTFAMLSDIPTVTVPIITAEAQTVSSSEEATVVKSGTDEEPHFTFKIPQGKRGLQGENGHSLSASCSGTLVEGERATVLFENTLPHGATVNIQDVVFVADNDGMGTVWFCIVIDTLSEEEYGVYPVKAIPGSVLRKKEATLTGDESSGYLASIVDPLIKSTSYIKIYPATETDLAMLGNNPEKFVEHVYAGYCQFKVANKTKDTISVLYEIEEVIK